jgi:type IV pilus assembly protein PilN
MARINLLPWRDELRSKRQKRFNTLAVFAVMSMAGVIGAVHWYNEERIAYQLERNAFLEQKTAELDAKIRQIKDLDEQRKNLLARMEIIQRLQASRPEIVHVFDELVTTLPEGVYYESVVQKENILTVNGIAQSNAFVSSLMRNLTSSPWLEAPALQQIKAQNDVGSSDLLRLAKFGLQFRQTSKSDEDDEDRADKG